MKRFGILALAIVATGAAVFAFRNQALRELRAEQHWLHSLPPPTQQSPAILSTNTSIADELSAAERNELLRLRGQIGVLRRELALETNRPVKPPHPQK